MEEVCVCGFTSLQQDFLTKFSTQGTHTANKGFGSLGKVLQAAKHYASYFDMKLFA